MNGETESEKQWYCIAMHAFACGHCSRCNTLWACSSSLGRESGPIPAPCQRTIASLKPDRGTITVGSRTSGESNIQHGEVVRDYLKTQGMDVQSKIERSGNPGHVLKTALATSLVCIGQVK